MSDAKDLFVVKAPNAPKKLPIDPTTDDPFYRYQMCAGFFFFFSRIFFFFFADASTESGVNCKCSTWATAK